MTIEIPELQKIIELLKEIRDQRAAPMPELLTVAETAEVIKISMPTLYRMISAGEIPHIKIGGRVLFDQAKLIEWLNEHQR